MYPVRSDIWRNQYGLAGVDAVGGNIVDPADRIDNFTDIFIGGPEFFGQVPQSIAVLYDDFRINRFGQTFRMIISDDCAGNTYYHKNSDCHKQCESGL